VYRGQETDRAVVERPLGAADDDLVERARRGDAAAYEELVQRHMELAFRTAYLLTGSAAEAEDAAQDAFVKAHGALGRFRPGRAFRPWLLRIVGNEARNRRRAAGRRAALELRAAREAGSAGAVVSPEAAAEAAEERRRLLRALDALGDEARLVVACRHLLQLTVEETATALGLPEGTVKSRLARALARLRVLLEADRDG
jgi:RNA polymerase sigma-70 factor (ECF subfamily)